MGSEIEQIVPSTLRLIALKDLNETLNAINNPTSTSIGTAFSELVIESATRYLLPQFPTEAQKVQAASKFKSVLQAIYRGPLVQGLINSNPISSTISCAIQQAGFFEKYREPDVRITRAQLKNVSDSSPLRIPVNAANMDGPSFTQADMEAFNNDLQKRVEFYEAMNQYSLNQNVITQQLYVDAKLIKKSVRASKTEICKLLSIDPNNASAGLSKSLNHHRLKILRGF